MALSIVSVIYFLPWDIDQSSPACPLESLQKLQGKEIAYK